MTLTAAPDDHRLLQSVEDELEDIFIVSQVNLIAGEETGFAVAAASGLKCETLLELPGKASAATKGTPTLCQRCGQIVANMHIGEVEHEG